MNSKVFIFILVIALLVSAGIVLFFAKRNPNPHFRPKRGEVVLVSIFMVFLSGGFSFFLSTLFESDINLQKMKEQGEASVHGMGGSGGGPSGSEGPERGGSGSGSGSSGGGKSNDSLPPFLQE